MYEFMFCFWYSISFIHSARDSGIVHEGCFTVCMLCMHMVWKHKKAAIDKIIINERSIWDKSQFVVIQIKRKSIQAIN